MRLTNFIDEKYPDLLYIMPESFPMIPFEIFKTFKRSDICLYETELEKKGLFKEYRQIFNTPEL
jgi:hypothetical protein